MSRIHPRLSQQAARLTILLLLAGNAWAAGEFVVGGGVEGDSADGFAASLFGSVAVRDDTWLSGGVARSAVDLAIRDKLQTWYADIGVDHYFDPAGIRLGAAYWGDSSILDSVDVGGSLYFRGDRASLSLDAEFRNFEFTFPPVGALPQREGTFDATGLGLSGRVDLNETVDLSLSAMRYDYSVDLRVDTSRDIASFVSVSRLSLINSLVDYRVRAGLGIDIAEHRIEFDIAQWRGAVLGGKTNSFTIRYIAPIGIRNDLEFGLGVDDSEAYGRVTFFSVFLYFYGGA